MPHENQETAGRRFWHSPYFWILSIFAISRAAYYAAGVRFDITPLDKFFQIADPLLLRTRLFETLLYLHTQPPGFNLMIGVVTDKSEAKKQVEPSCSLVSWSGSNLYS